MKSRAKRILSVLVCAIFLTGIAGQVLAADKGPMDFVAEAKAKIVEVTAQQAKADLDAGKAIILLDVRTPDEFETGHLPKAMNIPAGLLIFKVGAMIPDKNADVILYCRTGARSAIATAYLKEMGYTNVKNMDGAFKAWGEAGYPIYNRHGEFVMKAFEKAE